ncbi:IS1 family transposase, partial [Escherichia coli]|uniref:IS1 family transposase n=1 Tax=Escherichia coli TaxID=562 RepID=UPI003FCEF3FD
MASVSISCPSCSATDGVVRNGKSTAGHQRYLCSHCRKTWQLQFTYTASQPGTHQKIIDMAMNGVGCRATARMDEQWGYVGAKSRQRWLFYAYDSLR